MTKKEPAPTPGLRLGKMLSAARADRNETQAVTANAVGIAEPYLWRIEKGRQLPSKELLETLCTHLKVDPKPLVTELRAVKSRLAREEISEEFDEAGT